MAIYEKAKVLEARKDAFDENYKYVPPLNLWLVGFHPDQASSVW
jgi:hypothetical protein